MTPEKEKKARIGGGGIVDSTVELSAAATKFAIDQVETVLCAVASPTKAMDRLKRSIDHVTDAMNAPVEEEAAKEKTAKPGQGNATATPVRKAEPEREETAEAEVEVATTAAAFTGRKT